MAVTEAPAREDFVQATDPYRRELLAHCYRMLGSVHDAEDLVQETFLRAWRAYDRFEGRSSVRTWLYRIATSACLNALESRSRRPLPTGLGEPSAEADATLVEKKEISWLEPIPDALVGSGESDPAATVTSRQSVRLAFIAALQHLPPKQRAVLVLRDVFRWKASEVSELLDTSVASVNSALQRAHATLGAAGISDAEPLRPLDDEQRSLLERYVDAFERYDMDSLTSLLRDDATWSMPPYALWLQTHDDIAAWCLGPGIGCRGSRLIPVEVNGSPGYAQYKPAPRGGHEPWALQVLEVSDDLIAGISFFLDTAHLFPLFGLPDRLDA